MSKLDKIKYRGATYVKADESAEDLRLPIEKEEYPPYEPANLVELLDTAKTLGERLFNERPSYGDDPFTHAVFVTAKDLTQAIEGLLFAVKVRTRLGKPHQMIDRSISRAESRAREAISRIQKLNRYLSTDNLP